ncbi:uncharacterized protein [Hyperolius riggenbachi]|uniref:uncharacterized protein n=1 Tax=Hyperolius riggenbachi TaxID=752182 RepID=UPI0035A3763E
MSARSTEISGHSMEQIKIIAEYQYADNVSILSVMLSESFVQDGKGSQCKSPLRLMPAQHSQAFNNFHPEAVPCTALYAFKCPFERHETFGQVHQTWSIVPGTWHPRKQVGFLDRSIVCNLEGTSFDALLSKLKDALQRQDTNIRLAITPTERLLITLRFLATGHSYAALHYQFLMGRSTVRYLVLDTCKLIWKVLQPEFMPTPDVPMWEANMQLFWQKHDFPNCLGAVDGKHVRLVMPAFTGSLYYNYKKFFSLVVMAVVDPNLKFIYVDVGAYGSSHDSSVFQHSRFGLKLRTGQMTLPPPRPWPDTLEPPYPCVFVADEAFALSEHVMRPYAQRDMNQKKNCIC